MTSATPIQSDDVRPFLEAGGNASMAGPPQNALAILELESAAAAVELEDAVFQTMATAADAGDFPVLLSTIRTANRPEAVEAGARSLAKAMQSDGNKLAVAGANGAHCLVEMLRRHGNHPGCVEQVCAALEH